MVKITKEFEEIELLSGKIVNISITVTGVYEANYGADRDGKRGMGTWLKDEWKHEVDTEDDLSESDLEEISDKVEELVQSEDWDFDTEEQDLEWEDPYDGN